ncbi:ABC transporter substrate-binding protein [Rhizobium mongolense]|uniref:ABC transporter substrate-binding protein n=1 Tax=Rhizobium mongolense TaxID=57676 RepID=UPI003555F54E
MKRIDGIGALKIGVTAAFGRPLSIHTRTVFNAVHSAMTMQPMAIRNRISLIWISDSMSRFGGMNAAQYLIAQQVSIVVGHYSSSAANAARAHYRACGIPLILPASSDDRLTERPVGRDRWPDTFRLCAPNSQLASALVNAIHAAIGNGRIHLLIDDSRYGKILGAAIRRAIDFASGLMLVTDAETADCCIIVGHFESVVNRVNERSAIVSNELIFIVDDGVHPKIADLVPARCRHRLFGVAPAAKTHDLNAKSGFSTGAHNRNVGHTPPFFLETVAAVEIAVRAVTERGRAGPSLSRALATREWKTAMGRVSFSIDGDNKEISFSLWAFRGEKFSTIAEITN